MEVAQQNKPHAPDENNAELQQVQLCEVAHTVTRVTPLICVWEGLDYLKEVRSALEIAEGPNTAVYPPWKLIIQSVWEDFR